MKRTSFVKKKLVHRLSAYTWMAYWKIDIKTPFHLIHFPQFSSFYIQETTRTGRMSPFHLCVCGLAAMSFLHSRANEALQRWKAWPNVCDYMWWWQSDTMQTLQFSTNTATKQTSNSTLFKVSFLLPVFLRYKWRPCPLQIHLLYISPFILSLGIRALLLMMPPHWPVTSRNSWPSILKNVLLLFDTRKKISSVISRAEAPDHGKLVFMFLFFALHFQIEIRRNQQIITRGSINVSLRWPASCLRDVWSNDW